MKTNQLKSEENVIHGVEGSFEINNCIKNERCASFGRMDGFVIIESVDDEWETSSG